MITVELAPLESLNAEELRYIIEYCNNCFEPVDAEDLVNRVSDGMASVYRFNGVASGVFILAVGDGGLYVETVAGKDVVNHFEEIHDKIRITAAACGAKALYSYAGRPALKRLYERKTKARAIATLYKEDLK